MNNKTVKLGIQQHENRSCIHEDHSVTDNDRYGLSFSFKDSRSGTRKGKRKEQMEVTASIWNDEILRKVE